MKSPGRRVKWLLANSGLMLLFVVTYLRSQSLVQGDTVGRLDHSRMLHHVEVGLNSLGVGLEYRIQWTPFVSTDALVSMMQPGIAIGVTATPLWIFFVQGVAGIGSSYAEIQLPDGPPPFKPDYLYGWSGGVRIPIMPRKTRLYFIAGVGGQKYVQNHYQYSGGGFVVGPPPQVRYRQETRGSEVYTIGLGMSF